jgi:hypothetical protein
VCDCSNTNYCADNVSLIMVDVMFLVVCPFGLAAGC